MIFDKKGIVTYASIDTLRAVDLIDSHKMEFTELFYDMIESPNDAVDGNPSPWGCPWYFGYTVILKGETMEEIVQNYFDENCNEWLIEDKE